MTSEDPYVPPTAKVSDPFDPATPIRWKRIVGWGVLICILASVIHILGGFLMIDLRLYGVDVEWIADGLASFLLYLLFLRTTLNRHAVQLMLLLLVVVMLDFALGAMFQLFLKLAFAEPFSEFLSLLEFGGMLLACLLAYVVWSVSSKRADRRDGSV